MSLRRGVFSLHPLLEERGRIEEARFCEWIEIETEWNGMLESIRLLERAAVASHVAGDREPAARAAATEWNRSRAAFSLRFASERLRKCTERRNAAFSALCAARLDRRVIEKLEERWQAVWRRRRALNEAAALEDAAMLARATQ